jgi:hypothetical protein
LNSLKAEENKESKENSTGSAAEEEEGVSDEILGDALVVGAQVRVIFLILSKKRLERRPLVEKHILQSLRSGKETFDVLSCLIWLHLALLYLT